MKGVLCFAASTKNFSVSGGLKRAQIQGFPSQPCPIIKHSRSLSLRR
nr:MAG TPA_asm: hypothetical protein [Caudoviricetes sp.]